MFSFGAIDVMEITLLLPKYTLKAHFCGCWADIKVGVCVRERERIFAILKSIDWGLSAPSTHGAGPTSFSLHGAEWLRINKPRA